LVKIEIKGLFSFSFHPTFKVPLKDESLSVHLRWSITKLQQHYRQSDRQVAHLVLIQLISKWKHRYPYLVRLYLDRNLYHFLFPRHYQGYHFSVLLFFVPHWLHPLREPNLLHILILCFIAYEHFDPDYPLLRVVCQVAHLYVTILV